MSRQAAPRYLADADGVPASVRAFFEREERLRFPDAPIDTTKRDAGDGRVGLIGYEINRRANSNRSLTSPLPAVTIPRHLYTEAEVS